MKSESTSIQELIARIASGDPEPAGPDPLEAHIQLLIQLLQDGQLMRAGIGGDTSAATSQRAEDQARLISSLRSMLDTREAEIATLKSGGEIAAFRRYIGGFIRAHQTATTLTAADEADHASLALVRDLIADALDACGVETFTPRVGADYRREVGVADKPELIPAPAPERAFLIASVVADGYRREKADGYDVLVPAKVRVYTPQQEK